MSVLALVAAIVALVAIFTERSLASIAVFIVALAILVPHIR